MRDVFPIAPPPRLVAATKPYADAISAQSLPLHIHEVLFAAALYTFIYNVLSPYLSARIAPKAYSRLTRRTRLSWDVHVVSFTQACVINALSLWVIWFDEERKVWRSNDHWQQRIWAYQGSGGLCQSFALGYFLWDLVVCSLHVDIFGWGMLAHAISAVSVFAIGYRPFLYFSAPIFLLYELSSPFLNIHWFCDKLGLTGSIYQAINGAFLTSTFFGCRIVWGLYSSVWVFRDMYWVIRDGHSNFAERVPSGQLQTLSTEDLLAASRDARTQVTAFNPEQYLPLWIPAVYLTANVVLNCLNIFWFGKMIQTIRTRFDPPWGTKTTSHDEKAALQESSESEDSDLGIGEPGKQREHHHHHHHHDSADGKSAIDGKPKSAITAARERAEAALGRPVDPIDDAVLVQKGVYDDGTKSIEITGSAKRSVRSRRKA